MTKVGLIADVHGNVGALQVALGLLEGRVDQLLLVGDAMNEYRFSEDIIDLIRTNDIVYVVGNHELSMMANAEQTGRLPTAQRDRWEFVTQAPHQRLLDIDGKRLLMVHASPWSPHTEYLYEDHPDLQRAPELGVDFLVLGHTHVPMTKTVGSTLIINPGSAGDARGSRTGLLSCAILDARAAEVTFETFEDPLLAARGASDGR